MFMKITLICCMIFFSIHYSLNKHIKLMAYSFLLKSAGRQKHKMLRLPPDANADCLTYLEQFHVN